MCELIVDQSQVTMEMRDGFNERRSGGQSMVVGQDEQLVLNFIVSEKFVGLELIVEQFLWIRWEVLVSALGRFKREGLMTVHQVDSVLEIRVQVRVWAVV